MNSGRSSSEPRPTAGARARSASFANRVGFVLLAISPAFATVDEIPPPPDNPGGVAKPAPRPSPAGARKLRTCPRCGYLCQQDWHYCISCGWDLLIPVGKDEGRLLRTIADATIGVTIFGRPNRYSTAFPFGDTGLYLTTARALIGAKNHGIQVRTSNNRFHAASLVSYDLPSGVGLIRAEIPEPPGIDLAPESPQPPQSAWVVCYPIVVEDDIVRYMPASLHRGRLTATGQSGAFYVSFENLLRTDHAIENGCTGGPLIDARGRVAGMILASPDDGITYAAPLEDLQPIVTTLARSERPVRPFFGLGLVAPDERRRAKFGLQPGADGPLVAYLIPESPAETAGVRPGDLLVGVGGTRVDTVRSAGERLLAAAPDGPDVVLTLARDGQERQVRMSPVTRPERVLLDPADEIQESLEANLVDTESEGGSPRGLKITDLVRGGRGEKARFKDGDVIVSIDRKSVDNLEHLSETIRKKFPKIFDDRPAEDRLFPSSYFIRMGVRTAEDKKVTRNYINLFPDILAPPVY